MKSFIIKIQKADGDNAACEYLRAFESEDINLAVRAIDAALNRKPRKPRADRGKPRNGGEA